MAGKDNLTPFTSDNAKEMQRKGAEKRKEIKPFTVDKQIDHKIPISRGGNNNIKNLAICCKSCNSGKRDMTDSEYIKYRGVKIENS